jgi:putative membrane protein
MMWNGNGMNGRGYAVMAVSNILFLGVVAVGFVALLRYLKPADRHPPPPSTPEQVLADRYAHGDRR